jgi:hypothetical protein
VLPAGSFPSKARLQIVSDSQTLPFRPACRMRLFRRSAAVVLTHHIPETYDDELTVNKPAASF